MPWSDIEKTRAYNREYMRKRREKARKSGKPLLADTWHLRFPEKHLARNRAWQAANPDKAVEYSKRWRETHPERYLEVSRQAQKRRLSTPWGRINAHLWGCMGFGVARNSATPGKYNYYLGYLWSELRAHLEAQFTREMNWKNWGKVWEIDHIKPISSFKFESLSDPLFRKAWALKNLRPLRRELNATKGVKRK